MGCGDYAVGEAYTFGRLKGGRSRGVTEGICLCCLYVKLRCEDVGMHTRYAVVRPMLSSTCTQDFREVVYTSRRPTAGPHAEKKTQRTQHLCLRLQI